jgi:hypothetical protein
LKDRLIASEEERILMRTIEKLKTDENTEEIIVKYRQTLTKSYKVKKKTKEKK